MLRDCISLLVIQRLAYMLELARVFHRMVRMTIYGIIALHIVLSTISVLTERYFLGKESLLWYYVFPAKVVILLIAIPVGFCYCKYFKRFLTSSFKAALLILLAQHMLRIVYNIVKGVNISGRPEWMKNAEGLVLAVCITTAIFMFLFAISGSMKRARRERSLLNASSRSGSTNSDGSSDCQYPQS